MKDKKKIAKKTIILYVLNIIKLYSSEEYPVNQTDICNYLNDIHVSCDRKTVGRNIAYLQEFGYPIKKINGKGYYLDTNEAKESASKWVI